MHTGNLVNMVLLSVLGGRQKRGRRARRYLTGRGSFWSNPSTIMTAAGVAWGLFETLQQQSGTRGETAAGAPTATAPPGRPASTAPAGTPAPSSATAGAPASAGAPGGEPAVPEIPVDTPAAPAETPASAPAVAAAPAASAAVDEDAIRIVRLAVSAAFADGVVNEHERAAILQQARDAGIGTEVEAELRARRPLREIVAGVTEQTHKVTLYVLAFTILRADEQLSGAERIYLAQLAHLLGLDPQEVQALEKDVGERIDALGDQGQFGG
jgi:tellurite resistance protein